MKLTIIVVLFYWSCFKLAIAHVESSSRKGHLHLGRAFLIQLWNGDLEIVCRILLLKPLKEVCYS